MEQGETKGSCLFCCETCSEKYIPFRVKDPGDKNSHLLKAQMQKYFILRRILDFDVKDLSSDAYPTEPLAIISSLTVCGGCSESLKKAWIIDQQIATLQAKFNSTKKKLKVLLNQRVSWELGIPEDDSISFKTKVRLLLYSSLMKANPSDDQEEEDELESVEIEANICSPLAANDERNDIVDVEDHQELFISPEPAPEEGLIHNPIETIPSPDVNVLGDGVSGQPNLNKLCKTSSTASATAKSTPPPPPPLDEHPRNEKAPEVKSTRKRKQDFKTLVSDSRDFEEAPVIFEIRNDVTWRLPPTDPEVLPESEYQHETESEVIVIDSTNDTNRRKSKPKPRLSKVVKERKRIPRNNFFIKCPYCIAFLGNDDTLKRHIGLHLKRKKNSEDAHLNCEVCSYPASSKSELERHVMNRHTVKIWHCPAIGCSFQKQLYRSVRRHVLMRHPPLNENKIVKYPEKWMALLEFKLTCTLCLKRFAKPNAFAYHCKTKACQKDMERKEKQIKDTKEECVCEDCGAIFSSTYTLKQHRGRKHSPGNATIFICEICGIDYTDKRRLNEHYKTTHGDHVDTSKVYKCQYCDVTTPYLIVMRRHERTHWLSGEVGFKCNLCEKAYKTENGLKTHVQIIHPKEKVEAKCPYCNKIFPAKVKLQYHLKRYCKG